MEQRVADVVEDRIVIAADPDTIMDVIVDLEAYPDWQAEIKEVEILQSDDDGWATQARFRVDAMVAEVSYVLAYTYEDNAVRWTMVEGDKIKRNDGSYELTDRGDGSTEVRYHLQLEPGFKVPSMIRRQGEKRIVKTALQGLKQRVESLA